MAMTCQLDSLNMVTDGLLTLREMQPNVFYNIRVEMLRVANNPSGAFLVRMGEFVDRVEIYTFHEQVFQILTGTNLTNVEVFEGTALKQVIIGEGDITIEVLTFYNAKLERIPPTIRNLPLLTDVSISRCALRNISLNVFDKNTRLKWVDLSYNEIATIMPAGNADGDVPLSIENLYLSSNRLENIDMTAFAGLSKLGMIDLRYNNLMVLAADRTITWSNMEMLDISYNQLRTIDLQWLSAPNLKRLILSNNLLDKIPQRLRRFPNLQLIGLSDNRFAGIDLAPLNGLPELNSIDVSNNPATRYIRSSRPLRLPKLDTLYAEACALGRFNTSGIDLPVVSFISLAHNNFSTVPPLGKAFPTIESFSLVDNPLSCNLLKARADIILSGKLIMGPPQDASDCPNGSTLVKESFLLCCKA
ncbi:leucine-rich repeat transmembrane neuronal protein 2-like [Anopheles marshallii]|uniref:leucine-rich repeat transmembrane neuronal protein 2-like n=1 Tax=Anopheles marshallii TaxID=1521116 RepID=UPI00237A27AE|nr:leucine-rich repeat transmembrane neuronal protein 2-like [Anopheles marshallii]